jgi:hypothetical protein
MSFVYTAVLQAKKMLLNLDGWLEKAAAHGKAKGFDPAVLLTARLAPDQYPLLRQVQSSCDQAKFLAARLSGKEPPKHPDTEQTFDEVRARIRTCVAYLDTFQLADFAGAEGRTISLAFLEGKTLSGLHYAVELSIPNFYFHVTTAYAIMRHNGVDLGKNDYLGHLTFNN